MNNGLTERIRAQIDYLRQEIKELHEEMERMDSFDGFGFELRKRLQVLQGQLTANEGLLEKLEPPKHEASPA